MSRRIVCFALLCALAAVPGCATNGGTGECTGQECDRSPLEPTYEPGPAEGPGIYTTDYYFATTRAVANSTIVPAGRVPLFLLTIPIDVVFLPIAVIAGFFPGP